MRLVVPGSTSHPARWRRCVSSFCRRPDASRSRRILGPKRLSFPLAGFGDVRRAIGPARVSFSQMQRLRPSSISALPVLDWKRASCFDNGSLSVFLARHSRTNLFSKFVPTSGTMSIGKHQNIIGPLVQELRESKGLSRAKFAEDLRAIGWDIPEGHVEKIEAREVMVKDFETLYLLRALEINQDEFWRRLAERPATRDSPVSRPT